MFWKTDAPNMQHLSKVQRLNYLVTLKLEVLFSWCGFPFFCRTLCANAARRCVKGGHCQGKSVDETRMGAVVPSSALRTVEFVLRRVDHGVLSRSGSPVIRLPLI